jgi:23S rRNA (pseudouridine1915-N3)-methyltransferase
MPPPLRTLCEEYQQRLQRLGGVSLLEVAEARRSSDGEAERRLGLQFEAQRLRERLGQTTLLIPLYSAGRTLSSEAFAGEMQRWRDEGERVTFLIGGPDGLHPDLLRQGAWSLSLGAMTFPHLLVRVLLLEQLYRAYTLMERIPYHR